MRHRYNTVRYIYLSRLHRANDRHVAARSSVVPRRRLRRDLWHYFPSRFLEELLFRMTNFDRFQYSLIKTKSVISKYPLEKYENQSLIMIRLAVSDRIVSMTGILVRFQSPLPRNTVYTLNPPSRGIPPVTSMNNIYTPRPYIHSILYRTEIIIAVDIPSGCSSSSARHAAPLPRWTWKRKYIHIYEQTNREVVDKSEIFLSSQRNDLHTMNECL